MVKISSLGRVLATAGVNDFIQENNAMLDVMKALKRHNNGDWGEVSEEDAELNDYSVKNNDGRVLSAYNIKGKRVWIITEGLHDPEVTYTTVLFPSEY